MLGTFFRIFLCIVFAQVKARLFISSADARKLAVLKRPVYLQEDAPELWPYLLRLLIDFRATSQMKSAAGCEVDAACTHY